MNNLHFAFFGLFSIQFSGIEFDQFGVVFLMLGLLDDVDDEGVFWSFGDFLVGVNRVDAVEARRFFSQNVLIDVLVECLFRLYDFGEIGVKLGLVEE